NAEFNWRADELNDALAIAVVTGWSFDETFNKDVLKKLLNEYKGLGTVVAKHFHDSRKSLMEK
ncbi:phage tail assembly chaperone, partial [Salmonella enterica]